MERRWKNVKMTLLGFWHFRGRPLFDKRSSFTFIRNNFFYFWDLQREEKNGSQICITKWYIRQRKGGRGLFSNGALIDEIRRLFERAGALIIRNIGGRSFKIILRNWRIQRAYCSMKSNLPGSRHKTSFQRPYNVLTSNVVSNVHITLEGKALWKTLMRYPLLYIVFFPTCSCNKH